MVSIQAYQEYQIALKEPVGNINHEKKSRTAQHSPAITVSMMPSDPRSKVSDPPAKCTWRERCRVLYPKAYRAPNGLSPFSDVSV